MDNNKKFELDDDALDQVAGGRWGGGESSSSSRDYVRNENCVCSNCGGNVFRLSGGDFIYYDGKCVNCETLYLRICPFDFTGVEHWIE